MLYEIINPSDPYTIEYDDEAVVCITTLILGDGGYGLKEVTKNAKDNILPFFMFGGDPNNWFKETYGGDNLNDFIEKNKIKIVECLESVVYGRPEQRKLFINQLNRLKTEEEKVIWRNEWLDQRSSMNNIGGQAYEIANNLRKGL